MNSLIRNSKNISYFSRQSAKRITCCSYRGGQQVVKYFHVSSFLPTSEKEGGDPSGKWPQKDPGDIDQRTDKSNAQEDLPEENVFKATEGESSDERKALDQLISQLSSEETSGTGAHEEEPAPPADTGDKEEQEQGFSPYVWQGMTKEDYEKELEMVKLTQQFVTDRDDVELEKFYREFSRDPTMNPYFKSSRAEEMDEGEQMDSKEMDEEGTLWFEKLQDDLFPEVDTRVKNEEKCTGKKQAKGTKPLMCRRIDLRELHPTNIPLLSEFLHHSGMILGKKHTGLCAKCQRKVAKTVKFSRHLGLLPFVTDVEVADTDPRTQVYKYRTRTTSKTI